MSYKVKLIPVVALVCALILVTPLQAMQIFVKSSGNKTMVLEVEPTDSIDSIKSKIEEKAGIYPVLQTLSYAGKQLEEGKTLVDYSIQKDATLILAINVTIEGVEVIELLDNYQEGTYKYTIEASNLPSASNVSLNATLEDKLGVSREERLATLMLKPGLAVGEYKTNIQLFIHNTLLAEKAVTINVNSPSEEPEEEASEKETPTISNTDNPSGPQTSTNGGSVRTGDATEVTSVVLLGFLCLMMILGWGVKHVKR